MRFVSSKRNNVFSISYGFERVIYTGDVYELISQVHSDKAIPSVLSLGGNNL